MHIRLAVPIQYDSIVDGEGMRAVLWTQGCPHACPGCHNPHTHDFNKGYVVDTKELKDELILGLKYQDGITLSGGEPFLQPEAVSEIASLAKALGKNVWAYTGFTFETLLKKSKEEPQIGALLSQIDVLVDGKFDLELKSLDLYFKGSTNQRIIDVQKSLILGRAIIIPKYSGYKTYQNLEKKEDYIFV